MTEFKGTPGPWEVGRVIGCYIEGRNSWSHVCSVMDDHEDSVTEQESIYNRHLIAAAPELLEALLKMHRAGQKQGWANSYEYEMKLAESAIAKALGEEK